MKMTSIRFQEDRGTNGPPGSVEQLVQEGPQMKDRNRKALSRTLCLPCSIRQQFLRVGANSLANKLPKTHSPGDTGKGNPLSSVMSYYDVSGVGG